jgi:tetratricopeptide (TPR) repeat protein
MSEALQSMMRAVLNDGGQANRLANPVIAETRSGDLHLAAELTRMADSHASQGKQLEAESLYLRANAIRERLLADSDPLLLSGYCDLALLYDSMQLYERSEPIYKKIAAGWQSSVADGEGSMLARSLSDLAGVYLAQGKYSEAEQTYRQAQSTLQNLHGPDNAQVVDLLERLASLIVERFLANRRLDDGQLLSACEAYFELGLFYQGQREYGQAARLFRRAIAKAEDSGSAAESLFTLESERPEAEDNLLPHLATFAHSMQVMATACFCQGRYLESETLAKRALVLNVRASGTEHHSVARSLEQLAACLFRTGRYARASAHYRKSLAIKEALFGNSHSEVAAVLCVLAKSCLAQGDLNESENALSRAVRILECSGDLESPLAAQLFNCIADMSNMKGLNDQASSFARQAMAITEAVAARGRSPVKQESSAVDSGVQSASGRPSQQDLGRIDLKLLRLLAGGVANSELARLGSRSSFAVNRELSVLMQKLGELSSSDAQECLRSMLAI